VSEPETTYQAKKRLPEPEPEQTALGMEAVRRALAGEEIRLYSDEQNRLCVVPLNRGDVERV
jgi:hypothetical protein